MFVPSCIIGLHHTLLPCLVSRYNFAPRLLSQLCGVCCRVYLWHLPVETLFLVVYYYKDNNYKNKNIVGRVHMYIFCVLDPCNILAMCLLISLIINLNLSFKLQNSSSCRLFSLLTPSDD